MIETFKILFGKKDIDKDDFFKLSKGITTGIN